jgi:hypothetical protein
MIIKVINEETAQEELCLLEFQGELVGDLAGNELGSIKIIKVIRKCCWGQSVRLFVIARIYRLLSSF